MDLKIGCVGYSYPEWVGTFYPRHASQEEFLEMYGKVFDLVEIDSSFYRIPSPEMTREWKKLVPEGFAFSAKFPKVVTHEREFRQAKGRSLEWSWHSFAISQDRIKGRAKVRRVPAVS